MNGRAVVSWPMQAWAFTRKELTEVLRQPRTLLVMVLGPFVIMAAFGIGYRQSPPALRTVFVVPPENPFRADVDTYAAAVTDSIDFRGVVDSDAEADAMLADDDVDLVVRFPDQPMSALLDGKRATLVVRHTRLDPIERTAILFVSQVAVDEINAEVLAAVLDAGRSDEATAGDVAGTAREHVAAMRRAGGTTDAIEARAGLRRTLGQLRVLGTTSDLGADNPEVAYVRSLSSAGEELDEALDAGDEAQTSAALDRFDALLQDERATRLLSVDSAVLVRPLDRRVELAVPGIDRLTDWYAPAAVMLLVQQFGVAFGALAFVRERTLGIDEVYRIAPVGGASSVVGKYLAYGVVGLIVASALGALVVAALGAPVAGGVAVSAAVVALTLFASLGLGFVISLVARSDTQAVQYSMLVLLGSLFFSGFFLSLDQLQGASRAVAYVLPASYGMRLLRDTMLRGAPLDLEVMIGLGAYGLVAFVVAVAWARRRMAHTA